MTTNKQLYDNLNLVDTLKYYNVRNINDLKYHPMINISKRNFTIDNDIKFKGYIVVTRSSKYFNIQPEKKNFIVIDGTKPQTFITFENTHEPLLLWLIDEETHSNIYNQPIIITSMINRVILKKSGYPFSCYK